MGVNKVIYGDKTLIDLTADTVTPDKVLKGYTGHGSDGEIFTGSCEFDSNTQDATATESEILSGKTAYNKGNKITGSMKNNGSINGVISNKDETYSVPHGFHDGSGKVGIDDTEKAKLVASNIREGVTILGVQGTMSGADGITSQGKEVTSGITDQIVLPDEGYNYLTQVTVKAISYVESENSAGGTTVTIG